jgi:GNAT superfamily N-acetyltransferase
MGLEVLEVTDRAGRLQLPQWLARAEAVHRQLRPQLPEDYAGKMQRVFDGGGRMVVAVQDERVVGVAVWRFLENTFAGRHVYLDDLVTDEACRSAGVGHALLAHCEQIARELDCVDFDLDSGVQRGAAHRFYFREGYVIGAYHFSKRLAPPGPARG